MTRTQRHRLFAIVLTVLAVIGLLVGAVLLRMHAAPEPARLLPEASGILYVNVKPVRQFTNLGRSQVSRSPEYRSFVEQTGFDAERDLDEVAFAMHAPQDSQHETRYTEVIVGRFNAAKLADFFTRNARSRETYRDHEIFLIPYEDRVVRVTVLSLDMVAASNTGDPAHIDHVIDEFRRSPFASSGPRLLVKYYHDVPFGSLAWLITEVAPPGTASLSGNPTAPELPSASMPETGRVGSPLPFMRQVFGGGALVGSARYNRNVLLRAENFLKDEGAAKDRTEQLKGLLSLYQATESQTRPEHPDPDMEAALNSLKVEQKGDRVQVNASIPSQLIEKVFEAPEEPEVGNQAQPQSNSKGQKRRR